MAGNDPLVVRQYACFAKLVHAVKRFWGGVVVKEVKLVRGKFNSSLPSRLRVHSTSQLVKDPQRPVPSDYLLTVQRFEKYLTGSVIRTWITDPLRLSSAGTLNLLPSFCLLSSQSQRQALFPSPTFSKFSRVHSAFRHKNRYLLDNHQKTYTYESLCPLFSCPNNCQMRGSVGCFQKRSWEEHVPVHARKRCS